MYSSVEAYFTSYLNTMVERYPEIVNKKYDYINFMIEDENDYKLEGKFNKLMYHYLLNFPKEYEYRYVYEFIFCILYINRRLDLFHESIVLFHEDNYFIYDPKVTINPEPYALDEELLSSVKLLPSRE